MGVGRREAFGVRQLAAALFSCPNNVSVPISASEWFLRTLRQPPIGTRGNLGTTPQSGVKTQTTSLSPYLGSHADNEPVTLSDSLPKATPCLALGCVRYSRNGFDLTLSHLCWLMEYVRKSTLHPPL
ncbi:MAG: hypothetical protein GX456_00825 [Verrucomicrobia bacterium]|nr:hypothetical protein [Verrucomicrobiota bacterium]